MTLPYPDINAKPVQLMSPTERVFDGCFNQAVYSPVWLYMIYPIRSVFARHPVRVVRAVAQISPWLLFPYTLGMWMACLALRISLMLVGVLILGIGLLLTVPTRVKNRVSKWYNSL